jgi:hypothetical protein
MQVTLNVPESLFVKEGQDLKNRLVGIKQSRFAWTIKRYLIIGTASAVAGIVSDGLNRALTATGTDNRLISVQSVPNPKGQTPIRQMR